MAQTDFFPSRPNLTPQIYAYSDPRYEGMLKVGYTAHDVQKRVAEQYPVKLPDGKLPYKIVYQDSSVREDGTAFTDKMVHWWLLKNGFLNMGGEWFKCTASDVRAAMYALKTGTENEEHRTETFKMRDEQLDAVIRPQPISGTISARQVKRLTSFGTARCVLVRPLPPISWQRRWDGSVSSS